MSPSPESEAATREGLRKLEAMGLVEFIDHNHVRPTMAGMILAQAIERGEPSDHPEEAR